MGACASCACSWNGGKEPEDLGQDDTQRIVDGEVTALPVTPRPTLVHEPEAAEQSFALPGSTVPWNFEEEEEAAAHKLGDEKSCDAELPSTASCAGFHGPSLQVGDVILGKYRILDGPLGEGGWCTVWRAEELSSKRQVAVKTFRDQAMREEGEKFLAARFAWEVQTFRKLGVAPDCQRIHSKTASWHQDPRELFVNLLDFSKGDASAEAGRAPDGRYYTVLELADYSLEGWLGERAVGEEGVEQLRELAEGLAASLAWLHGLGLCHLDLKPANVMRFGRRWKLIDVEGAMSMDAGADVATDGLTPLYTSPELAEAILTHLGEEGSGAAFPKALPGVRPTAKMDIWSAGVILLDVLARESAFMETMSGFQTQAMMSFEEADEFSAQRQWYQWLVDPSPVTPLPYASPAEFAPVLEARRMAALLEGLLHKEPQTRLSTEQFLSHAALRPAAPDAAVKAAKPAQDDRPEAASRAAGDASAGVEGPGKAPGQTAAGGRDANATPPAGELEPAALSAATGKPRKRRRIRLCFCARNLPEEQEP